jgi:uncharacterized membrane protein YcaP (DUF421 family)
VALVDTIQDFFKIIDFSQIVQVIIASALLYILGFFIIRFSGKKSVGQMDMPHFVMAIVVGSVLANPLSVDKTILGTIISVIVMVLLMIFFEFLSVKNSKAEKLIESEPVVLIKDGRLQVDTLRRIRLTVDALESLLRQQGIASLNELRTCTLEINGQLGYEKKKGKSSLTYDDFVELLDMKTKALQLEMNKQFKQQSQQNFFDEVREDVDKNNNNTELD